MNSWDGYRALVTIVEKGSFSRAARELGISQPTASRRIEELEQSLGARLLVRRSRGVVATPAGERVLAEARRMAQAAAAASRLAGGNLATEVRHIRISATEGLGTLWLPHQLAALGTHVDLVIDNAAVDLSARQADIAIRLFKPRQPDVVARKVGTLAFAFFASPKYLAAHGTPRRLEDLARHDHVGFLDRGIGLPAYIRWLQRLVPADRFVTSASTLLAMYELGRAGSGIVLGTRALLAGDRKLVHVLPRARPPTMDIWLAVHADLRRDPQVTQILDALAARCAHLSTM